MSMKFVAFQTVWNQLMIIPTFGFIKPTAGFYKYKYRIAFAWLFWRVSIGFGKVK